MGGVYGKKYYNTITAISTTSETRIYIVGSKVNIKEKLSRARLGQT